MQKHNTKRTLTVALTVLGALMVGPAIAIHSVTGEQPADQSRLAEARPLQGRQDPRSLKVVMHPERPVLAIEERTFMEAQVGRNGYLVVLEFGPSGKVNLIHPPTGLVDHAQVRARGVQRLPREDYLLYAPTDPGVEWFRALLFDRREQAEALLSVFPPQAAEGVQGNTGIDVNRAGDDERRPSILVGMPAARFFGALRNLGGAMDGPEPAVVDVVYAVVPRDGDAPISPAGVALPQP